MFNIHTPSSFCTISERYYDFYLFLLVSSLFLPGRSGTIPYSLVALLVAVRLSQWKWVKTESFRIWLEETQHSSTNWNGFHVTSPYRYRRNMYGTNIYFWSQALCTAVVINLKTFWHCQFRFKLLHWTFEKVDLYD